MHAVGIRQSGQVGAVVDDQQPRRVACQLAQDSGACQKLAVAEGLFSQLKDVCPSFHEDLAKSTNVSREAIRDKLHKAVADLSTTVAASDTSPKLSIVAILIGKKDCYNETGTNCGKLDQNGGPATMIGKVIGQSPGRCNATELRSTHPLKYDEAEGVLVARAGLVPLA